MYLVIFNIGHLSVYGRQAFKNKLGGIQFMQKHKRLFSLLIALAMILSLLPVMASAATMTGGEVLYLKPNSNWLSANQRFSIYVYGSSSSAWANMTDSDSDGIYEVTVPTGSWTNVIFCRMNGGNTTNDWTNRWNQTNDLTYDGTNNCYTVADGAWSNGSGSWSYYEPPTDIPEWESPIVDGDSVTFNYWSADTLTSVEVRGIDAQDVSWSTGLAMTQDAETGIWSATLSGLYNGTYEYKFVTNGADWINDPKNTGAMVGSNNTFTITDGLVDSNEPEYTSPVVSGTSVTFNYWRAEEFTSATVYGDMSDDDWGTAYPMVKNEETGVWSVTVDNLYNGTYEYKIVVDEAWLVDPKNTNIAASGNSYFEITEGEDKPVVYPEIVYLLPNFNWISGDAAFAAYFYNDTTSEWVSMTDGNVDGVYEAYVPEGMTSVVFCRMDPNGNLAWNSETETNVWNQSDDIAISTEGYDLYIMDQYVWGKDTENPWAATWATYEEVTVPEFESPVVDGNSVTFNYWHYAASSVSVHGSMDNWGEGYEMTKGEDGTWSVTINDLPDAMYTYKLVVDGCWITDPNNWEVQEEADGNKNSIFIIGDPVIQIWNAGYFFTFEEAYAASDPDRGDSITLLADVTVNDLVVDKEMYLDLNGHDLTMNVASATAVIYAQDCVTTDPAATEWGTLIVNGADYEALGGYVMLPEAEGHSFHSFSVEITHISLAPNSDALGYKAQLIGDSYVQAAVTGFGFEMSVAGGQPKTFTKNEGLTDGTFTLRLKNIMANDGGEMEITASAFVIFGEEQSWNSGEQTTTMKETIQLVDAAWSTYSETQQTAVKTLLNTYYSVTQHWDLENIFLTIDIPITQ